VKKLHNFELKFFFSEKANILVLKSDETKCGIFIKIIKKNRNERFLTGLYN